QLLVARSGRWGFEDTVGELRIADEDGGRVFDHPSVRRLDLECRRPAIAGLVDLYAAVIDIVVYLDALCLDQPTAIVNPDARGEVFRRACRPVTGIEAIDL